MLATVRSATLVGVVGHRVDVEVHVGRGLPSFSLVGLPDAACREARDRVRAAVLSSGLAWPTQRITVNLAPSSVPKIGTGLDVAIAVGVLVATGVVPADALAERAFFGELGLDGSLRRVRGIVPLAVAAAGHGRCAATVVPDGDAAAAAVVPGVRVLAAPHLEALVAALRAERPWPDPADPPVVVPPPVPDLAEVRGQAVARAAVEIAAAGGHHLLLSGPPGSGKTMLARRLPGLLPDLDDEGAMEVTGIHSAGGEPVDCGLIRRPPFRSPHHGASAVAMIGGGSGAMRPGEVALAHRGVLFCDELGEFAPTVLDALRQPLEEGVVRVSRAGGSVTYPAAFQFVAATNPCPCGPRPDGCRCSAAARQRYGRRLSGPLLDRFDLRAEVDRPDAAQLLGVDPAEPTAVVAARVLAARERMSDRGLGVNARLSGAALDRVCPLDTESRRLLGVLVRDGALSGRGVARVRRVARTVADLAGHDGAPEIGHVAEALAFRVSSPAGDAELAS